MKWAHASTSRLSRSFALPSVALRGFMCRGAHDYVGWLLAECDGCVYLPDAFARLLRDEL